MDNMANKVARIPNLVDWSTGEVRLMSAKCNSCGTYFFPKEHYQHRPGCSREGVEDVLLSSGLVEFEDEKIQVTGIITDTDLKALKIGMEMETTILDMYTNEEKQQVVTWAFKAIE